MSQAVAREPFWGILLHDFVVLFCLSSKFWCLEKSSIVIDIDDIVCYGLLFRGSPAQKKTSTSTEALFFAVFLIFASRQQNKCNKYDVHYHGIKI